MSEKIESKFYITLVEGMENRETASQGLEGPDSSVEVPQGLD